MSNKQSNQYVQPRVVDNDVQAKGLDEQTEQVVTYIPITVTATLRVPHTYLLDVEGNTAIIREQVEELSASILGSVVSVDLK